MSQKCKKRGITDFILERTCPEEHLRPSKKKPYVSRPDFYKKKRAGGRLFLLLIKTVTKFSIVIGYQQPDLIINWTVAHHACNWTVHIMLVIGQYASFCSRNCGALCE